MDGWIRWMMLSMDGEDSFIHLLFVRVLLGFSVFDEILISFFLYFFLLFYFVRACVDDYILRGSDAIMRLGLRARA